MRLFHKGPDGGPQSTVTGWFLIEIKGLFSVVLMKFGPGSRDAYHSHAFNCLNWMLKGHISERHLDGHEDQWLPSWLPFVVRRRDFHKTVSWGTSWLLSIRGPWSKTWKEYRPAEHRFVTLTNGRKEV